MVPGLDSIGIPPEVSYAKRVVLFFKKNISGSPLSAKRGVCPPSFINFRLPYPKRLVPGNFPGRSLSAGCEFNLGDKLGALPEDNTNARPM